MYFMNRNQATTGSRDTSLENFAAELTEAAYPVVLQHGVGDRWLDLELDLWKVLANTAKKWFRQCSPSQDNAPLRN
jgi:hypothetical protein